MSKSKAVLIIKGDGISPGSSVMARGEHGTGDNGGDMILFCATKGTCSVEVGSEESDADVIT